MGTFMRELMEIALTHDMIVMTVILVFIILGVMFLFSTVRRFVILGVMLLLSTVRRIKVEPERVSLFDLKSCDICYRGPYHGEKLGGWKNVEGLCVCSDCSSDFP